MLRVAFSESAVLGSNRTLARKTIGTLAALTVTLVAAGGAAIWALLILQRMAESAHEEFTEFVEMRDVERNVWAATTHLEQGLRDSAAVDLDRAIAQLDEFDALQTSLESQFDAKHASAERDLALRARDAIRAMRAHLAEAREGPIDTERLAAARRALSNLMDELERAAKITNDQTRSRFGLMLALLAGLFAATLGSAVIICTSHYRSVIGPLTYVRDGVRRLTGGDLSVRLSPRGDAEFTDLQGDFNRMAAELESLYRDLERRVAEQSKQLAVSERLAGVGFLAAGVAHEINNPLAIMSGHAESLLRRLRSGGGGAIDPAALTHDLEIIREEAFRCKKITQDLLDLARPGDQSRGAVSMWQIIHGVTDVLRLAPDSRHVLIETSGDADDQLLVAGSEPELKRVLLNLAMNALAAVSQINGRVELRARRDNGWVELCVYDNGCGMTPETAEHVFEPFFTTRRNPPGVGLGLAISHAIVRRHQGVLLAASDGPGKGSVFTLRLPAAEEPHS